MRPEKRAVAGRIAGAVVLLVVTVGLAAPFAGTSLVLSKPIDDPDIIVSLASHEWERLPTVATCALRFPHALVVLTLPQKLNGFNCHDCGNRTHRLELAGVPARRVRVIELTEGGTYGEALAVRRFVSTAKLKRVLVVTSPYHTRRALATFESVMAPDGVRIGVEPASATSRAVPRWWWLLPDDRAYVPYEWAAIVYYAVRHRVY